MISRALLSAFVWHSSHRVPAGQTISNVAGYVVMTICHAYGLLIWSHYYLLSPCLSLWQRFTVSEGADHDII